MPPLAASASTAEVGVKDGVRFGHPVPATGSAWSVAVHAVSRSSDPGGAQEQISTYDSEYTVEVVAVEGPAPSRVRLRFARNTHSYQSQYTPTAIDGKEYIVDSRAPHVRDVNDAAAPEPETQRVLDIFPDLGSRTRIDEVLPDDAMRIGDRRDDLAAAILRVIHPRAWSLRIGTATLHSVEGEDAVFKVSIDAASDNGMHMALAGEARVRLRDARLTKLALDGPYDLKKKDGTTDPPGVFSLVRQVSDR